MQTADVVLTITTDTKGRIRFRRAVTLAVAAGAASLAAVTAPAVLTGSASAPPASAIAAYTDDTPDLKLDCLQWAKLDGIVRRQAAAFYDVTLELANRARNATDFSPPPGAVVSRMAAEVDGACRRATAAMPTDAPIRSPLVIRALRDFS